VLVANRVLDKKGIELLHRLAAPQRVVEVETLVQIDAPVAVRAHTVPDVAAILRDSSHHRPRIEHVTNRNFARVHAKRPKPGFHRGARTLLQGQLGIRRCPRRTDGAGGVALAVIP
jgi:hypothetical protein